MFDVINNLYPLIVSVQMETGSVLDRSNNISVSIGLQNVMDRYGADFTMENLKNRKMMCVFFIFSLKVSNSHFFIKKCLFRGLSANVVPCHVGRLIAIN